LVRRSTRVADGDVFRRLSAPHRQLVPEYGDLDVLRVRSGTEPHQSNDATDDQNDER
jgi:hypothetical protein